MDYKIILGITTLLIALVSYGIYFKDVFSGSTKPHAFSWFVWSVLSAIAFVAQMVENAGPGAWITGFTAIACFIISVVASFKNSESFSIFDWGSLAAAMTALILWHLAKDPTTAVILISLTFALGFLPTFRKAFYRPNEETATTFALNGLKFFISLFALSTFSVSTALYPLTLVTTNFVFVLMLMIRRKSNS